MVLIRIPGQDPHPVLVAGKGNPLLWSNGCLLTLEKAWMGSLRGGEELMMILMGVQKGQHGGPGRGSNGIACL
jgi:hypothetical protein